MKIDAHPISGERVKSAQTKPAAKRDRADSSAPARADSVDLSGAASARASDTPLATIDDALSLAESLGPLPSDAESVHTAPGADHTWDLIRI